MLGSRKEGPPPERLKERVCCCSATDRDSLLMWSVTGIVAEEVQPRWERGVEGVIGEVEER